MWVPAGLWPLLLAPPTLLAAPPSAEQAVGEAEGEAGGEAGREEDGVVLQRPLEDAGVQGLSVEELSLEGSPLRAAKEADPKGLDPLRAAKAVDPLRAAVALGTAGSIVAGATAGA